MGAGLQDDDDVMHQIVVLHNDNFMRTYTVNEKEFEVIKNPEKYDETAEAKFRGTECILDSNRSITEDKVKKVRSVQNS